MADKEQEQLKKLLEALKKLKISPQKAEKMLKKHNAEEATRKHEQEMREFRKGLWFRNLLAFILLAAIFLVIVYQAPIP